MRRLSIPCADNVVPHVQRVKDYLGDNLTVVGKHYNSEYLAGAWKTFTTRLCQVGDKLGDKTAELSAVTAAFLQQTELLNWTKALTEAAATVSDKAMDANYLTTPIGGGYHRLFDKGHTIPGSWDAVKDALKTDSKTREIGEWAHAYMKDFTTPMGMPFATLDKGDFNRWAEHFTAAIPGVDKRHFYDLLTFDALEIMTTGLSVVAVCFAFTQDDKTKLAEILGAMGISSITAANPIIGLATIATTAYAYWKHGNVDLPGIVKGGGLTAFSAFLFSIMGLHVMVELAIVVSLSIILRKYIFDSDEFTGWLKSHIQNSLTKSLEHVDFQRWLSLVPARQL